MLRGRFRLPLLFLAVLLSAQAETPALLEAAVNRYIADAERWAFTQTSVGRDAKGRVKEERVTRFDPSRPYEEQWTPLKLKGKEPTEKEIERYRKRQEKRRKERPSFGEILAFDQARQIAETDTTVTFEIPLIKTGNKRLPPEKFVVTAIVNKELQAFELISVRIRESLRVALVAKVRSGEVDLRFGVVDPQYAPTVVGLSGSAEASVMFVQVGGDYELERSDFVRVTPYSERFKVKIAPLKLLDF